MGKVFKIVMRYVFSHLGLCILLSLYCVAGAFLFMAIEASGESDALEAGKNASIQIEDFRENLREEIYRLHICYLEEEDAQERMYQRIARGDVIVANYPGDIMKYMAFRKCKNDDVERRIKKKVNEYHEMMATAINDHGYDGTVHEVLFAKWTFASALVFTVSIITLIGYGHVFPVTQIGHLVVILYSLLAVPLMLMFLANIGKLFAAFIRLSYAKGCCHFCYRKRIKTQDNYEQDKKGKLQVPGERKSSGLESIPLTPPETVESNQPSTSKGKAFAEVDDSMRVAKGAGGAEKVVINYDLHNQKLSKFAEVILEEDNSVDILKDGEHPVPIVLTLGIIVSYTLLGSVMFYYLEEEWTLINSTYFSFVTLSTIGFGDFVPGYTQLDSFGGKMKLVAAAVYIVFGLAVLSMGFDLMVMELVSKAKKVGKVTGIVEVEDKDGDGVDDDEQINKFKKPDEKKDLKA